MFYTIFCNLSKKIGSTPTATLHNLKMSGSNLSRWRNGGSPTGEVLLIISNYFNVSIDYLLGKTDNPNPPSKDYSTIDILRDKLKNLSPKSLAEAENYINFLLSQEKNTGEKPKISEIMNKKGDKPSIAEIMEKNKKGERKIAAYGGGVNTLEPKEELSSINEVMNSEKKD